MKNLNFTIICLLCTILLSSCEVTGIEPETELMQQTPKIQFYADPALYNNAYKGLVITSISINNVGYIPKSFVDNCSESFKFPVSGNFGDRNYLRYKINIKNYGSLDAMMNNLPFASETHEGILYEDVLLKGCNTLQVKAGYGAQLHILDVK